LVGEASAAEQFLQAIRKRAYSEIGSLPIEKQRAFEHRFIASKIFRPAQSRCAFLQTPAQHPGKLI
jgi:hypothetical protein